MIQSTKVGAQALEGTNDGAAVGAWGQVAEFEDEHGSTGGVGEGEEVVVAVEVEEEGVAEVEVAEVVAVDVRLQESDKNLVEGLTHVWNLSGFKLL